MENQEKKTMDVDAALARVSGNRKLLAEMAEMFLAESPRLLADIHTHLEAGDGHQLSRAAHRFKGAVSNFDATAAREASDMLETAAQNGDLQQAQQAWAHLKMVMSELTPMLERVVQESSAREF